MPKISSKEVDTDSDTGTIGKLVVAGQVGVSTWEQRYTDSRRFSGTDSPTLDAKVSCQPSHFRVPSKLQVKEEYDHAQRLGVLSYSIYVVAPLRR